MNHAGSHLGGPLQTRRLLLLPLSVEQLRRYLADRPALERELGLTLSQALLTPALRRAVRQKLIRQRNIHSDDWLWLTYWLIIIRETQFGAGMAGFKGMPNTQGDVEIGYGIDPDVRRQGYMTEAAGALVDWAFRSPKCRSVSADTRRNNPASQRVLEKIGMSCYRESADIRYWRLRKMPAKG